MACGLAVIARPRVSSGSVGAMLKLGRWLGLVCENCTAVQDSGIGGGPARAGTGSCRGLGPQPRAAEVAGLRGIGGVVRNGGLRGAAADGAAGRGVACSAECLALLEGVSQRGRRLRVCGRQRCEQRGRERDELAGAVTRGACSGPLQPREQRCD